MARVGSVVVSKAMFNHWLAIAVAIRNPPAPGHAPARPAAPEPPSFAGCVADHRAADPHGKLTAEQLESGCQREYADLEPRVLHLLIYRLWREGEARELGITVNDQEAREALTAELRRNYSKPGTAQRFLAETGQTMSDLLFATKSDLLARRLAQKAAEGLHGKAAAAAVKAFGIMMVKRWTSRTYCGPGFVVPGCKAGS
ncbi:MAG TPA: hypothetical protein VGX26_10265 [Solirubrobacteraceae bacterium]|nr:hypothetical protein [Solirubrobacteraceae bacterium]